MSAHAATPSQRLASEEPAYRLAVRDPDFLLRDEMRGLRFAMEYEKASLALADHGIASTVTIMGSARIPSREDAEASLAVALSSGGGVASLARARKRLEMSRWYEMARSFGRIVSERGGALKPYGPKRNVVLTGGGPGIMEAGNRGASEAGAPSIGMGIELPHEQGLNAWVTPGLGFNFHYFHVRKFSMVARSSGIAIFPGGFGSLDECFECLTLLQVGKSHGFPVVLFGREWWERLMNLPFLADEGLIERRDLDLVRWAESAEDGWQAMLDGGLTVPA